MDKNSKIYVAGHTGLVGSAFVRKLKEYEYMNIIVRTHSELDLINQKAVEEFFEHEKPEYVIDAAALVGGIKVNSERPADFLYQNMQIEQNIIWSSYKYNVKKLLFLGSACMYPKECEQPMKEEGILTGLPEITNEAYAIAKIAGCRLCSYINQQYGKEFISAIPANTYGIGDSFDSSNSHVIPALIRKYHEAKLVKQSEISLWGTGKPKREFIYVDDIASAGIFLLNNYAGTESVNIGTGEEVSIMELSRIIKKIVGYEGKIVTDITKPDGMMRRMCDNSKINKMGWKPEISLEDGIKKLYQWYIKNEELIK